MKEHHVFPWWAGYLLISPFRKLTLKPEELLRNYLTPGMKLLDTGCAMGFFSLPMAEITGSNGTVYCIDPQPQMLTVLNKRAKKRNLTNIITRSCSFESLMVDDLSGKIDCTFAFAVLHEVKDKNRFIGEIRSALKPEGLLIFGEPHVITDSEFNAEITLLKQNKFTVLEQFSHGKNHFAVLRKY